MNRVTLQGTYGDEWAVDLDDVLAIKATKARQGDGTQLPVLKVHLRGLTDPHRHSTFLWLADDPTNREALGMAPRRSS